jgi:hypothetical protein
MIISYKSKLILRFSNTPSPIPVDWHIALTAGRDSPRKPDKRQKAAEFRCLNRYIHSYPAAFHFAHAATLANAKLYPADKSKCPVLHQYIAGF